QVHGGAELAAAHGRLEGHRLAVHVGHGQGDLLAIFHVAGRALELDRLGFRHRQVAIANCRQINARQVSAVAVQDPILAVGRRVARLVGHVRLDGELAIRQAAG
ncbi:unnamed protein product, partial [Onchocerca ochengi]